MGHQESDRDWRYLDRSLANAAVDVRLPPDRWAKKRSLATSGDRRVSNRRAFVPTVGDATPLAKWLSNICAYTCFVLDPRAVTGARPADEPNNIALLIGPEGGLTDEEVALAKANEFIGLSLGPRIMRTETAPLAALSVIGAIWGDLNCFE